MLNKTLEFLKKVPKGKVITYKQLANMAGIANARIVGLYLHQNKQPDIYPCHRVIRSDGKLANGYKYGGIKKQRKLLEEECIVFINDKIDLNLYGFK